MFLCIKLEYNNYSFICNQIHFKVLLEKKSMMCNIKETKADTFKLQKKITINTML